MSRTVALTLLLFAVAPQAAEIDTATLRMNLGYGYGQDDSSSMLGLIELVPELDVTFGPDARLVTSARIRLDSEDDLEPGRPNLASYAGASRPVTLGDAGTAELRDFFVEWQRENATFRLGKQQIVWGRLDGIKVLDVVNPQEFREFILDDFGDSRIGLWSAYADVTLGSWRAELALLPDATRHAIPDTDAWFELTAPRFRFGSPFGAPTPPVDVEPAGHTVDDAAAGLRLSRRVGRFDFSAVAYTGQDHEPLGRLVDRDGVTRVERFAERRELYGLGMERSFGRFVLRGEYALQPGRAFNLRDPHSLAFVELDQHRAALGLDMDAPLGLFINAQYLVDLVSDAPVGLVRPARDEITTLFVRRSFGYDKLALELRWYHSVHDSDDMFALGIDYLLAGNTVLSLGAERFSGTPDGLFGQFDRKDRITLTLGFTF